MLISLRVENFKSFDRRTEFNMIASKKLRNDRDYLHYMNDLPILKSSIILGHNASGKSNLVDVFRFIKDSITDPDGFKSSTQSFCKSNKSNELRPSFFEIKMLINEIYYTYSFSVILSKCQIINEMLTCNINSKSDEILFLRTENEIEKGKNVRLDKEDSMRFKVYASDNAQCMDTLFLTEMNRTKSISNNSGLFFFKKIYDWFDNNLKVYSAQAPITNFEYYYNDISLEVVKKLLRTFDTGINDIRIKKIAFDELKTNIPDEIFRDLKKRIIENLNDRNNRMHGLSMRSDKDFFNIRIKNNELEVSTFCFKHLNSIFDFEFGEESDGTRRIFDLLDILLSKNNNSIYIIDEMERSLHPNLTRLFVQIFKEYSINSKKQLIFTTHEATLLDQDLYRRDQIWFADNDFVNGSDLYSLDKFNERNDKRLITTYLKEKKYGGVSNFGDYDIDWFNN